MSCFDNADNTVDCRFSLLYLKDFTNTELGESCVLAPQPSFGIGVLAGALWLSASRRRRVDRA